jgi:hypothetical protein
MSSDEFGPCSRHDLNNSGGGRGGGGGGVKRGKRGWMAKIKSMTTQQQIVRSSSRCLQTQIRISTKEGIGCSLKTHQTRYTIINKIER